MNAVQQKTNILYMQRGFAAGSESSVHFSPPLSSPLHLRHTMFPHNTAFSVHTSLHVLHLILFYFLSNPLILHFPASSTILIILFYYPSHPLPCCIPNNTIFLSINILFSPQSIIMKPSQRHKHQTPQLTFLAMKMSLSLNRSDENLSSSEAHWKVMLTGTSIRTGQC